MPLKKQSIKWEKKNKGRTKDPSTCYPIAEKIVSFWNWITIVWENNDLKVFWLKFNTKRIWLCIKFCAHIGCFVRFSDHNFKFLRQLRWSCTMVKNQWLLLLFELSIFSTSFRFDIGLQKKDFFFMQHVEFLPVTVFFLWDCRAWSKKMQRLLHVTVSAHDHVQQFQCFFCMEMSHMIK